MKYLCTIMGFIFGGHQETICRIRLSVDKIYRATNIMETILCSYASKGSMEVEDIQTTLTLLDNFNKAITDLKTELDSVDVHHAKVRRQATALEQIVSAISDMTVKYKPEETQ